MEPRLYLIHSSVLVVLALESCRKGSRSSVVDEERMRPGHWLRLLFWHWWLC